MVLGPCFGRLFTCPVVCEWSFECFDYVCIQLSHLTHSNDIVSVCVDLNAVMFAHYEHCIPYATQLCVCMYVCVCACVCGHVQ